MSALVKTGEADCAEEPAAWCSFRCVSARQAL